MMGADSDVWGAGEGSDGSESCYSTSFVTSLRMARQQLRRSLFTPASEPPQAKAELAALMDQHKRARDEGKSMQMQTSFMQ